MGNRTRKSSSQESEQTNPLQGKWGPLALKAGWVGIPTILLQSQARLGLTSTDVVVLAHMIRFWWTKEKLPFPSLERMAEDMGIESANVVRSVARLRKKKLIEVVRQEPLQDAFDLTKLVYALERATVEKLRGERRA